MYVSIAKLHVLWTISIAKLHVFFSRLQETRQLLTFDLNNKVEALDVDLACLSVTDQTTGLSLKPRPTRGPAG